MANISSELPPSAPPLQHSPSPAIISPPNFGLTGKLSPYIDTTIGCAFSTINRMTDDGIPIQFQIWDTAGQERYRALSKLYFRNAEIILLCFTVDSRESFDNLTNWIKILKKECINKNILCNRRRVY